MLLNFPNPKTQKELHLYVDSDWGNDRAHQRSVTGMAHMLAGGVITYKAKYQATVALSLAEAEFTAAAEAGKTIL